MGGGRWGWCTSYLPTVGTSVRMCIWACCTHTQPHTHTHSTVDVLYPASPFFIAQYPVTLLRMLLPLLVYSNNETSPYGLDMPYNLSWVALALTLTQALTLALALKT